MERMLNCCIKYYFDTMSIKCNLYISCIPVFGRVRSSTPLHAKDKMMKVPAELEKMHTDALKVLTFLDPDPAKKKERNERYHKRGDMFKKLNTLLNRCLMALGFIAEEKYTHLCYEDTVVLDGVSFTMSSQNSLVDDDNEYYLYIGRLDNPLQVKITLETVRMDWGAGPGGDFVAEPKNIVKSILSALRQIGYIK